jgi:putative oxidoreductase
MLALPKAKSTDLGILILRLMLAGILLFHGIYKINHGVAWIKPLLAQFHLPGALAYGTYIAEFVAPVLLIVGLQVRLAALAIVVDMCMAIFLVLRRQIFALKQEPGGGWAIELQALLLFSALALVFLDSGSYSLRRKRNKTGYAQSV